MIESAPIAPEDEQRWFRSVSEKLRTADAQMYMMLEGQPVNPEDLEVPYGLVDPVISDADGALETVE